MERDQLLEKAGRMADLALLLVGGQGLNGVILPVSPDKFSEVAVKLRAATEAYNAEIISAARR